MTYPDALAWAKNAAKQYDRRIYIAECAIYARGDNEFEIGPYIVGSQEVFAIAYDRLQQLGGKVVAVVAPDGSHFCNDLSLTLSELADTLSGQQKPRARRNRSRQASPPTPPTGLC